MWDNLHKRVTGMSSSRKEETNLLTGERWALGRFESSLDLELDSKSKLE